MDNSGNPVITHGNGVVVEGGAPRTFDYKRWVKRGSMHSQCSHLRVHTDRLH